MTEEEKKKATEAEAQRIAAEQEAKRKEDEAKAAQLTEAEAKIKAIEAEKAAILEREANYKLAYLKEKKKNEGIDPDETEEERIRRITREELANTRLNQLDGEKEELLQKTLRENKELRLANQNKPTNIPAGGGGSTEHPIVVSTVVTPEQISAFKARGWSDKDIERYKKNLQKNSR